MKEMSGENKKHNKIKCKSELKKYKERESCGWYNAYALCQATLSLNSVGWQRARLNI